MKPPHGNLKCFFPPSEIGRQKCFFLRFVDFFPHFHSTPAQYLKELLLSTVYFTIKVTVTHNVMSWNLVLYATLSKVFFSEFRGHYCVDPSQSNKLLVFQRVFVLSNQRYSKNEGKQNSHRLFPHHNHKKCCNFWSTWIKKCLPRF